MFETRIAGRQCREAKRLARGLRGCVGIGSGGSSSSSTKNNEDSPAPTSSAHLQSRSYDLTSSSAHVRKPKSGIWRFLPGGGGSSSNSSGGGGGGGGGGQRGQHGAKSDIDGLMRDHARVSSMPDDLFAHDSSGVPERRVVSYDAVGDYDDDIPERRVNPDACASPSPSPSTPQGPGK